MDHTSRHHHSSRQLPVLAYLFILCPYSNVRITHPSPFGVFPNLKLAGPEMSYSPSFPLTNLQIIWRCVAVCNLSTSATLATDLYVSKRIHAMPLASSNNPIRHVYVYYFNHHILQSTTQVTLENPVWYIQQRFHAGLPFHAPFSSCGRWYVFLLDLADLPYLLPSAQFSMTILTFYRDDA